MATYHFAVEEAQVAVLPPRQRADASLPAPLLVTGDSAEAGCAPGEPLALAAKAQHQFVLRDLETRRIAVREQKRTWSQVMTHPVEVGQLLYVMRDAEVGDCVPPTGLDGGQVVRQRCLRLV